MTYHYRDTTFISEEHKTLRIRVFAGSGRASSIGGLWARQREILEVKKLIRWKLVCFEYAIKERNLSVTVLGSRFYIRIETAVTRKLRSEQTQEMVAIIRRRILSSCFQSKNKKN
jgi:hypothetical protein